MENIEHILNDCLNKALCQKGRIQQPSSNTIADFVSKYIQAEKLIITDVGCSLPNKIEVNFDGNLLAEIETTDKNLKVLRAVNGYGEAVNVAKIQVVKK